MAKYFGTDGFRGEAGITLTADHAYKVGRFHGWYYNALRERNGDTEPARIVIGSVLRKYSDKVKGILSEELLKSLMESTDKNTPTHRGDPLCRIHPKLNTASLDRLP